MKYMITVSLVCFALVGCGKFDKLSADISGHSIMCVQGVSYVQFSSGSSPLYSIDGKLVSCK